MKPILFSLYPETHLFSGMAQQLNYPCGDLQWRQFPDGETYLRFATDVTERDVILMNSLDNPNSKTLPLLFAAATAKELGAKRVGLCAAYLAYMRQDKRFHAGEGITSRYFAALLSAHVDWLVTVDPHLHRYHDLREIYTIPTTVLHAAAVVSQWIASHIERPVLIGPDSESEQWVSQVAAAAAAPYTILQKIRHGDLDVEIKPSTVADYREFTPVLVDDIISTGQTMIETITLLKQAGLAAPVCIGVHGVFAEDAYHRLLQAGAERVITCNTIEHASNRIDVSSLLSEGVRQYCQDT